jgi:uncharacterized protein YcbK (DUF882 family)
MGKVICILITTKQDQQWEEKVGSRGIELDLSSNNQRFGVSRRRFLHHLASAAAGTILSPTARAFTTIFEETRELSFFNLHTLEKLTIPYDPCQICPPSVLSKVNHLLRDHRTDKIHPIDPALLDILHAVSTMSKSRGTFKIISGYRAPESNAMLHQTSSGVASRSLHMEGKAVDVRLSDIRTSDLRRIGMALGRGGVGYYPGSDFVHLDTGQVRTW